MKSWNIEVFLLDEQGHQKPATCFTKVVYNLHPSFVNPVQSKYSFRAVHAEARPNEMQHSPNHHSVVKMKDGESLI